MSLLMKTMGVVLLLMAIAPPTRGAENVVPPPAGPDTVQDVIDAVSKNFPDDYDLGELVWVALTEGQTNEEYLDDVMIAGIAGFYGFRPRPGSQPKRTKRSFLEWLIDKFGELIPDLGVTLRQEADAATRNVSSIALGRELVHVILNTATLEILSGGGTRRIPQAVDFYAYDGTRLATIPLDEDFTPFVDPTDMAITNDRRSIVVAVRGSDPIFDTSGRVDSHLAILDIERLQRVKRIYLSATDWPVGLALSADDQRAYLSVQHRTNGQIDGAAILVVALENGSVVERIELPFAGGTGPGEIVTTPDGALLFLLTGREFFGLTSAPSVTVVDTRTMTVTAVIGGRADLNVSRALGPASQIAMDPTGTRVYVSDALTPQSADDFTTVGVAAIDTATATLTRLIPIPGALRGGIDDLQVSRDGRFVVHADGAGGLVTTINTTTFELKQKHLKGAMAYLSVAVGP